MDWIDYPNNKPDNTQTYLVSIERPYIGNTLTFLYIAHYDVENDNWHKYDSFSDDNSVGEIIKDRIIGFQKIATII